MQFPATAKASRPLLVCLLAVLAAGCSVLDTAASDQPVIRSEVRAPGDRQTAKLESSERAGDGTDQDDDADDRGQAAASGDDQAVPSVGVRPAPGSSDLDPALSPDPDIEYRAGSCYRQRAAGEPAEEVPCREPHHIEVYASIDLPGGPGAPYQGLEAAFEACGAEFMDLTGVGLNLATVYERSVLRPSEETWADGERVVTCYVVYPDLVEERLADINPVRSFGRASVFGLAAGDCLADFDDAASWFEVVRCDQLHEAEVFIADVQPDGDFPGDAELDATADELCFGQPFEDYVGRDYASSAVFSLVSVPTAETWQQGDRTINCILTDEQVRTESFENSGR